jgi:hypothetical protein
MNNQEAPLGSLPATNEGVPHISRSLRDVGYANLDVNPPLEQQS